MAETEATQYLRMVEFHNIYCPCERCAIQRELEKIRREK